MLRPAQADTGASVRHHQSGDGLQAILLARAAKGQRRVESGDVGLECETNVHPPARISRKWTLSTAIP